MPTTEFFYLTLRFRHSQTAVEPEEAMSFAYSIDGEVIQRGDNDEETLVGKFGIYYMDVDAAGNAGHHPFDMFDGLAATMVYYEPLFGGPDNGPKKSVLKVMGEAFSSQNVLILDRLEILPEYRGKGVGLVVLRRLIERFEAGAGMVCMKPYPLQFEAGYRDRARDRASEWDLQMRLSDFSENKKSSTATLQSHYAKLGFKRVPGTDLMIRGTDELLPKVAKLNPD